MKDITAIDLSGYSFTGKSAVYDLLAEFDFVKTFGKEVEFDIIRVKGGIRDLYYSLVVDWSPVRSSSAIRDFISLVHNTSGDGSLKSRLFDVGSMNSKYFPSFKKDCDEFLASIVTAQYMSYWPFYSYNKNRCNILFNKLFNKITHCSPKEKVYLARLTHEEFLSLISRLLGSLFRSAAGHKNTHIVLNNSIEPYNTMLLEGVDFPYKQLIVDRDPRDVYLAAKSCKSTQVSEPVLGRSVDDFITRYKMQRKSNSVSDSNSLSLCFEDLVLDYDNSLVKIINFLGISRSQHSCQRYYFNPEISMSNIGAWKQVKDRNIQIIEKELSSYLYKGN